jgi:hypothetical protein
MSKRITTYMGKTYYVNIRYYPELDEYVAKLFRLSDNEVIGEYFTDDLGEAMMTGEAMLRKADTADFIC